MKVIRAHVGSERLSALTRTDNWRNVLYVGGDWAAIAAAIVASVLIGGPIAYVAAVIVIGVRQRALMNLIHQASHNQLFADKRLNNLVGRLLVAYPLGMSLEAYKRFHLSHHRFLWDERHDPKTLRYAALDLIKAPGRLGAFALKHLLRPVALVHVPFNVKAALAGIGGDGSERGARLVYWAVVGAAVAIAGVGLEFVAYWVVPYLTSFQVIRYWIEAAEHGGLQSDDLWMGTRSWSASPVTRWFLAPHADSYHLAHHMVASVPHYRLGALHRELMRIPEYAAGHHCDGFFFPRRPDAPSVVQDMCWPERLGRYKQLPAPPAARQGAPVLEHAAAAVGAATRRATELVVVESGVPTPA